MIGIFDSGIGGLSVLKEIVRILPDESFVYYADNAHCPYGEKSREYLIDRARHITRFLLDKGADIIVVACNTATAAAISTLRKEWPEIAFVGIEPAIKLACGHTRSGVVGVLATPGTLRGDNYLNLCVNYSSDECEVVERSGKGFVEIVERMFADIERSREILNSSSTEKTVRNAVEPLLNAGADTIVLGCTHYPFLESVIRRICGDGVEIINPAPAVAAQAARLLKAVVSDRASVKDGAVNEFWHSTPDGEMIFAEPVISVFQKMP